MKIAWHGHSCFEIKDSVAVVTDPHDGKSIGITTPVDKADVLLISQDHYDHNCSTIVRGDFALVKDPGERVEKGVRILGFTTAHDENGGSKRGKNTVFRFELDGLRFCHCGDLGHDLTDEQLRILGDIDILFVPVGGVFTIDGAQARKLVERMNPKIATPMHFRVGSLSLSIQTVDPFLTGLPDGRILRVGNEVDFTADELPSETEYWVFSP